MSACAVLKGGKIKSVWKHNHHVKKLSTGWSESSLGAQSLCWFCHDGAHIIILTDVDPDEIFPLLPPEEAEGRKNLSRLRTVISQAYDEVDHQVVKVELDKYVFPFENLVFEGGGNKGLAYCGAIRVSKMSRLTTKPTKWLSAQQRLRSAWASAQSDQPGQITESSLGAHSFCWFCHVVS